MQQFDRVTSALVSPEARGHYLAAHPDSANAFSVEGDRFRMYGYVSQINEAIALGRGLAHDPVDFTVAPPRVAQMELDAA